MLSLTPLKSHRLWAPLLAGMVAFCLYLTWKVPSHGPTQVVLNAREESGNGLSPTEVRAFRDWVQWELEAAGLTVLLSDPVNPASLPPRTLVVELIPQRRENHLLLHWRQSRASQLALRGEGGWDFHSGTLDEPRPALLAFSDSLRPPGANRPSPSLLPQKPQTFWALLEAVAGNRDSLRLGHGYDLALEATRTEPGCAMAWMVLGDLHYRQMLLAPLSDPMGQEVAEKHFRKALQLAPNTPQAIFLLAQLKVDSGDHTTAMNELAKGLKAQPNALSLRSALVYAARTAGLMELTRETLKKVDALVPVGIQANTAENAWLYLGNRERFEESLQSSPDAPRSTVAAFYQGYLALSDGNRVAAAAWFHRSRAGQNNYSQFADLAEVFELIASAQPELARAKLQALSDNRVGLRVPDGEFTFKLAEAHALLGDLKSAQETADQAFSQGFGCTTWYDHSPFLEPIRNTARWRALHGHLLGRQRLLEETFPPSAFS